MSLEETFTCIWSDHWTLSSKEPIIGEVNSQDHIQRSKEEIEAGSKQRQ
jgi:hypothetical protein